jgi:hypothetical protein
MVASHQANPKVETPLIDEKRPHSFSSVGAYFSRFLIPKFAVWVWCSRRRVIYLGDEISSLSVVFSVV